MVAFAQKKLPVDSPALSQNRPECALDRPSHGAPAIRLLAEENRASRMGRLCSWYWRKSVLGIAYCEFTACQCEDGENKKNPEGDRWGPGIAERIARKRPCAVSERGKSFTETNKDEPFGIPTQNLTPLAVILKIL